MFSNWLFNAAGFIRSFFKVKCNFGERQKSSFPVRKFWKSIILFSAPFVLLPLPLIAKTTEARCGYVILLMAAYWVTEAIPIPVTALIPVFAYPLLGIVPTGDISLVYMRGTAMMFLGGLIMAVAVEHCNLHKRIALLVILSIGQSPRRLLAGFMLTTMFLSMFISNTAATAMMVPILEAILQELQKTNKVTAKSRDVQMTRLPREDVIGHEPRALQNGDAFCHEEKGEDSPDVEGHRLSIMYFLATAYASNLGGTGFPTGTGPNLVLWGNLQSSFSEPTGLDFATWMAFNVPGMLILVFLTSAWLEFLFVGCGKTRKMMSTSKEKEEVIKKIVQFHYDGLGRMTFHEVAVLLQFLLLTFLWVFRAPEFITGWAEPLENAFGSPIKIGNATPAILVVFLLFVIPAKPWFLRDKNDPTPPRPSPGCLTWKVVHEKVPWGLVILMGGGFAMTEGSQRSGLSAWLGQQLQSLEVLPGPAIVFIICAIGIQMHPLYLMLPAAVCCSYAFMIPVANPPNAIAFNASNMKNTDMIRAGFVLNVISILVMTLLINTLGVVIFDLHNFPQWANSTIS